MANDYQITAANALKEHKKRFLAGIAALTTIAQQLEDSPNPNWGHVGSAGYAIEHINEVLRHYGITPTA